MAAQFTIVRKSNEPRSPSTDERFTKMCYIFTIGFYSALSKDEIFRKKMSRIGKHCAE